MKKKTGSHNQYSPTGKPTSGPHGTMGPKSGDCCSATGQPTGGKNTGKVA